MSDGTINFPPDECLKDTETLFPYFFAADDAFPLQRDIIKPYPFRNLGVTKRIFNYRLSRARRVVENAFGILANRFRVFLSPILLSPEKVEAIILAACALHNFLRARKPKQYFPPGSLDCEDIGLGVVQRGDWRNVQPSENAYEDVSRQSGNRYAKCPQEQRDQLCRYVNREGRVPWQQRFVD